MADDVTMTIGDDHVAVVELRRPPNNFFDIALIRALAAAYDAADANDDARVVLLCSEGKHFCAGADFAPKERTPEERADEANLYWEAIRLFSNRKPVVAAVQGGAIGGGLGLACSADFRVAGPSTRFAANFARLGFHHGFGLTVTLPEIVGKQHTLDLLYRGRRVGGEEALALGLCDEFAADDDVRGAAHRLAADIAISAPLAVEAIRATVRGDLATRVRAALEHELEVQRRLNQTDDFREGVMANAQRRDPEFKRR